MFTSFEQFDLVLRGLLLTAAGMIWIVLLVRIVGLRSFSKMTNFDFVMTVATGSLLAGAVAVGGLARVLSGAAGYDCPVRSSVGNGALAKEFQCVREPSTESSPLY